MLRTVSFGVYTCITHKHMLFSARRSSADETENTVFWTLPSRESLEQEFLLQDSFFNMSHKWQWRCSDRMGTETLIPVHYFFTKYTLQTQYVNEKQTRCNK